MKTNERAYWTSVFTTAIDNPIDATTAPSGLPAPLPALSADLAEAVEALGKTADDIRADVGKVQAWRRGQVLLKRLEQAQGELREVNTKLTAHQKAHGVKSTPTSDAMVKRAVELSEELRWLRGQTDYHAQLDAEINPIAVALESSPATPARPAGVVGKLAEADDIQAQARAEAKRTVIGLLAADVAGRDIDATALREVMSAAGLERDDVQRIRDELADLAHLEQVERDLQTAQARWSDAQATLDRFNADTEQLLKDRRADGESLERNRDVLRARRDDLAEQVRPLDTLRMRYGPIVADVESILASMPLATLDEPVEQTPPKSRKAKTATALPSPA